MARITSVCVYCGASFGRDERHGIAAARLGRLMAERGLTLVYGGGGVGLMGELARACLGAGGAVVGVIPRFLSRAERKLEALTRLEVVDSMHERKARMFALADAFIVLPGGLGTLEETLETLTWRQLGLHAKPIVLVDLDDHWRPLRALLAAIVAQGFAEPAILDVLEMAPSVEAALDRLSERAATPRLPEAPERL